MTKRPYYAKPGIAAANKARRSHEAMLGRQSGPRTPEGKLWSGRRSLKHGARSAGAVAFQRWVASINRLVRAIRY